jgi:mycothiol synthase
VAAATHADGVGPLSEHVLLHLRYGGDDRARDVLARTDGEVSGYAHLDPGDAAEGASGELVVHPAYRRQGQGRALVRTLLAEVDGQPLRLWAHGDAPAAAALARAAGFERVRALWQMRRSLRGKLDEPRYPDGVTVRTFAVGQDEEAWLEVNRRAFAHHPEQGAWTSEDIALREREPWFDPDGFFLAERSGRLVGFHWTKIHGGSLAATGHRPDVIGEVYVVGVDPGEQGTGLGRALTLTGLHYLRSRGLTRVMLYADEANTPAIKLYESLGFARWATDVMFRHPGGGPAPRQAPQP